MAKFLFRYHGGRMPETDAEAAEAMAAWGAWFGTLGAAVVDGDAPVGPSKTVEASGNVRDDGGPNPTSGYSLVEAPSVDAAVAMAKGCPILAHGGSVEVCETIDLEM